MGDCAQERVEREKVGLTSHRERQEGRAAGPKTGVMNQDETKRNSFEGATGALDDVTSCSGNGLGRGFTGKQAEAVSLLLAGKSPGEVAQIVGVGRTTIYRWRQREDVAAVLRQNQERLFSMAADQLRYAIAEAMREIRRELTSRLSERRLKTAYRLLPYVGAPRLNPGARRPRGKGAGSGETNNGPAGGVSPVASNVGPCPAREARR